MRRMVLVWAFAPSGVVLWVEVLIGLCRLLLWRIV